MESLVLSSYIQKIVQFVQTNSLHPGNCSKRYPRKLQNLKNRINKTDSVLPLFT